MSETPERIWATGNSATGSWNSQQATFIGPAETEYVRVKALQNPTDDQVRSACLSYRHDFGLLSPEEQRSVEFVAREWLHAWQKEILR